ncbi:MAG: hypothetical protein QM762_09645 [Chryseolinea sp.]
MNFRYNSKHRSIAPEGRTAVTMERNMHSVLGNLIADLSAVRNEQIGALDSFALTEASIEISPSKNRKIKSFEAKTQKLIQQQMLKTMDYSFDFGQIVFSPINSDTQFLTLPFDSEWHGGPGVADKDTGRLSVGSLGGNATFGSGLGLFISSPDPVNAYVRALMPIDYQWGHVIFDRGFTGSSGTVGILVYDSSTGQIVGDKRATLWDESMWMASMTTTKGEDRVYLTQTKAAEVSFYMAPGKKYQVWFWLNVHLRTVGLALVSALIQATIPLVLLNSSPVLKLK